MNYHRELSCERTHCHASSNSGYIIIVYVYMYVYACIHIYVYIYRFYKNVSCMFRYHPWLGRFLIAILHTDEESLARPRTASGKVTARDNLRKRSRTRYNERRFNCFFFPSWIATSVLSSLSTHRSCENETHRYRYLRYRNTKRTHRGNASFKLTLLVWLEFLWSIYKDGVQMDEYT